MPEPQPLEDTGVINSIEGAEQILPLKDTFKIAHRVGPRLKPDWSLFSEPHVFKERNFWPLVIGDKSVAAGKLRTVSNFLRTEGVMDTIGNVHEQVCTGYERSLGGRVYYTNLMLLPLLDSLFVTSPDQFPKALDQWKKDWSGGVDPEKFRFVFSTFFKLLQKGSLDIQQFFVPGVNEEHPVREEDVDLLAGLFEKAYVEINDMDKIKEADQRNKKLTSLLSQGKVDFSSEDLFHTTDLNSLPAIAQKGLLCLECTSLTQDGHRESTFGVSFYMFNQPPKNLAELGHNLATGNQTARAIDKKIHLAFLNPQSVVEPDYILYPPDSFHHNRSGRKNMVAGKYIGGYDSDASQFPNKSIAYVLIGMPSTATSFAVMDSSRGNEYAQIAKGLPFYLPGYSYEGVQIY